jgi:hypothetical protein
MLGAGNMTQAVREPAKKAWGPVFKFHAKKERNVSNKFLIDYKWIYKVKSTYKFSVCIHKTFQFQSQVRGFTWENIKFANWFEDRVMVMPEKKEWNIHGYSYVENI